jgi:transposase-like protein
VIIQLPVTTEVLEKIDDLNPNGRVENNQILIEFDTRKRDYHKLLGLSRKTKIGWSNERTFDVQELSSFPWPILYRITTADGYYKNERGERIYFTPEISGLSTYRKVSDVTCRLAVYLYVIAGLGTRQVSKLMKLLFQVEVSKSSIDRWVREVADSLPSEDEIIRLMNQQLPITQGHFDELFPLGGSACLLVLKDEHGRLVTVREVAKRDEEHVKPVLEGLKKLGLKIGAFYIDHCQAYVNAIGAVFPEAHIQHDYFHILQNIWRKVWREMLAHRRDLQARGEAAETPWYSQQLLDRATNLWKNRYVFFTADENLTEEQKKTMNEVLISQPEMSFLRGFLEKVWAIFEGPLTESEAEEKLAELTRYAARKTDDGYTKSIAFLKEHFKNMTTFLRVPGVQRNSEAETGMRVLRRWERNHDGFRSEKGRSDALRIYQSVAYLGWSIRNPPNLTTSDG